MQLTEHARLHLQGKAVAATAAAVVDSSQHTLKCSQATALSYMSTCSSRDTPGSTCNAQQLQQQQQQQQQWLAAASRDRKATNLAHQETTHLESDNSELA
jgi:hypothetical protein